MTTMTSIQIDVPYAMRHLRGEIKRRQGRFDSESKTWSLPDTEENREFAKQFEQSWKPAATPEERVRSVATTATELLTALRLGQYQLIEATPERVVIRKEVTA